MIVITRFLFLAVSRLARLQLQTLQEPATAEVVGLIPTEDLSGDVFGQLLVDMGTYWA